MISTDQSLTSCWRDLKTLYYELMGHLALFLLLKVKCVHWLKRLACFEIRRESQGLRGLDSVLAKEDPVAGRTWLISASKTFLLFTSPLNMLSLYLFPLSSCDFRLVFFLEKVPFPSLTHEWKKKSNSYHTLTKLSVSCHSRASWEPWLSRGFHASWLTI